MNPRDWLLILAISAAALIIGTLIGTAVLP